MAGAAVVTSEEGLGLLDDMFISKPSQKKSIFVDAYRRERENFENLRLGINQARFKTCIVVPFDASIFFWSNMIA